MDNLQHLIAESAQLLIIGMGTVFVILVMLIFLITWTSKLLARYQDEPAHVSAPTKTISSDNAVKNDNELIAVISTAVNIFRKRHNTN